ncbi:hypothetical protein ACLMJV_30505 [Sinorhizobium meliloti]|uniref:hypothetical protein n=1 Tax=Rhizobium meliloti TaxID=382 RepID=UPI00398D0D62
MADVPGAAVAARLRIGSGFNIRIPPRRVSGKQTRLAEGVSGRIDGALTVSGQGISI